MNNLVLRATCLVQSFAAVAKDRRGVAALEYGLLAALIAVAVIAAVSAFSGKLTEAFTTLGTSISTKASAIQ
jgi:pilus assembly protein Flp/PilA